MVNVTFVTSDGSELPVVAEVGHSLMETAVRNGIPGIIGECGGYCACGTCLARVNGSILQLVNEPGAGEQEMLEILAREDKRLRLTCQIVVTNEMEGARIYLL